MLNVNASQELPAVHRELPGRDLDARDRCEARACNAQAYVEVTVRVSPLGERPIRKMELTFCGHHFAEREESLKGVTVGLNDQRERLLTRS